MEIRSTLRHIKQHFFKRTFGEKILKAKYKKIFNKEFDGNSLKTFTEKLFHRMIALNRHGNPMFTRLADKYLVRRYVAEKVGDELLIKLLWHGTDPSKIPFDTLPARCVVKTNHGSGGNIVLKAGYQKEEVIAKLKTWLSENFYWVEREYHYYEIPPMVLVEEYIDDGCDDGPLDFRFWCFNGKPVIIQVDNHSHSINAFYDLDWNALSLSYRTKFTDCAIEKPVNFPEMVSMASKLAEEFDFVRVDLYNARGKIYFGEMTFTPVAGNLRFEPARWDAELGAMWELAK